MTVNIRLHIFHTGIWAKFLKLRCKNFKSYLFDNKSLTFCIAFNREAAKYPNEKPSNAFLKRQLWIGLARKLKIFILLILSKNFWKFCNCKLTVSYFETFTVDKNLHYFKFFKHKKTDRFLQNCGLFEIFFAVL